MADQTKFPEATIELDRWMTKNMHCEKYEFDPICALREMGAEGLCELLKRIDAACQEAHAYCETGGNFMKQETALQYPVGISPDDPRAKRFEELVAKGPMVSAEENEERLQLLSFFKQELCKKFPELKGPCSPLD